MTAWDPETGDREVLTTGGEPSPRRPLSLLTAVAAAGLLAGFLAGGGTASSPDPRPVAAEPVQLVAGSVEPASTGHGEFEVSIHNSGSQDVGVSVVGIPDWDTALHRSAHAHIAPGTWQSVRFTAEVNCTQPPFTVRSIEVRTSHETNSLRAVLPLANPGTALHDYHLVECTRATTLHTGQLVGVWMLDEFQGEDSWLANRFMIWLRRDGTFVWDADGQLLGARPGNVGRYAAHARRLRFRVTGGWACGRRDLLVWETRLLPDQRLELELVKSAGRCSDGPGLTWVLRRVLDLTQHRLR